MDNQKYSLPCRAFLNTRLSLPVVGVLCQETVYEQKSISSRTVNHSGPPLSILLLQDGWVYFCLLGWFYILEFKENVSLINGYDIHIELVLNAIKSQILENITVFVFNAAHAQRHSFTLGFIKGKSRNCSCCMKEYKEEEFKRHLKQ